MKMRYELGMATRLDTLQAAVALANIEPDLRDFRQRVANAGSRLNAVMGRDPAAPLTTIVSPALGCPTLKSPWVAVSPGSAKTELP